MAVRLHAELAVSNPTMSPRRELNQPADTVPASGNATPRREGENLAWERDLLHEPRVRGDRIESNHWLVEREGQGDVGGLALDSPRQARIWHT